MSVRRQTLPRPLERKETDPPSGRSHCRGLTWIANAHSHAVPSNLPLTGERGCRLQARPNSRAPGEGFETRAVGAPENDGYPPRFSRFSRFSSRYRKKRSCWLGRQDLICWSASGLSVVARFGTGQEGRRPEARGGSLRLLWIARGGVHLWLVERGMGRKQLTMLFMLYVHHLPSLRQTKRLTHAVWSQSDPIDRGPLVHVPGSRSNCKGSSQSPWIERSYERSICVLRSCWQTSQRWLAGGRQTTTKRAGWPRDLSEVC